MSGTCTHREMLQEYRLKVGKPEETARVRCGYVWIEYQNGCEGTMCADMDGIKPAQETLQWQGHPNREIKSGVL